MPWISFLPFLSTRFYWISFYCLFRVCKRLLSTSLFFYISTFSCNSLVCLIFILKVWIYFADDVKIVHTNLYWTLKRATLRRQRRNLVFLLVQNRVLIFINCRIIFILSMFLLLLCLSIRIQFIICQYIRWC